MGRGWRSKEKRRQAEAEHHETSKAIIFISSDDDEANEDLSLEIVNKCQLRDLKRKRDDKETARAFFHDLSTSSTDEIADIPNGKATRVEEGLAPEAGKEVKKKRKKSKKKKRKEVEDEAQTETPHVPSVEVESSVPADSVIELVNNETSNNIVLRKLLRGPRYFDSGPDSWESCYNCGEEGHVAANCKEERRQKPCFSCGMFGHNAKSCLQGQDCFICKRKGHHAKDCPHKHEKKSQESIICLRCGDLDHDMASCRNDYASCDLKEIQCYICKKYGHICCVDYTDNSAHQISCYNCAEPGHTGQGCAKQRGENNTSTPSTLCYSCGQKGHFARGCTKGTKSVRRHGESSTPRLSKGKRDSKVSKSFLKKAVKVSKFSKSVIKHHGESSISARDKKHKKDSKVSKSLPKNYGRNHAKEGTYLDRSTRTVKSKVKGGWIVDDTMNLPKRERMPNDWASPITPSGRGIQNYSSTSIGGYSSSHTPSTKMHDFHASSGGHYSSPYAHHQRVNYYARTPNSRDFTGGYHHGYSASRFSNSYGYYG